MPTPREIAKQVNNASDFEEPTSYDPIAGVPSAVAGSGKTPDLTFNPVNPPVGPSSAKNLKR